MSDRFRGEPPPRGSAVTVYDVIWPSLVKPADCTLLDGLWLGIPVHWVGEREQKRRTVLCTRPLGQCMRCASYCHRDWRGYMPIYSHGESRVVVLVVGFDVYQRITSLVPEGISLKGQRLIVRRLGADKYGRLDAKVSREDPKPWTRPTPDIVPTLVHMYGRDAARIIHGQTAAHETLPADAHQADDNDHIPFPSSHQERA